MSKEEEESSSGTESDSEESEGEEEEESEGEEEEDEEDEEDEELKQVKKEKKRQKAPKVGKLIPIQQQQQQEIPTGEVINQSMYLVGGQKKLNKVLVKATISHKVTDAKEIIKSIRKLVNKKKLISFATPNNFWGTTKISRSEFGVAQHNSTGEIEIIGPGRWLIYNPLVKWRGVFDLKEEYVHVDQLVIVNVKPNQYARVRENNYPYLLAPGRHIRFSGTFKYKDFVDINQDHLKHNIMHIVQVPRGQFAKIHQDSKPYLVPEGVHCFVHNRFKFDGMAHGKLIKHGTITRFRVDKAEVGLAWENQHPVFFVKPGYYYKDSEGFLFVGFESLKKKLIKLGSKKIVTVFMGEVGVTYREGKLCILPPGRHFIDHQNHHVQSFMSTQRQAVSLAKRADEIDGTKDGLFECETKDLVKIGIRAVLVYKVENPEKALMEIGDQAKLEPLLLDTAISQLNGIIRCTTLTEVAKSSDGEGKSSEKFLNMMRGKEMPDDSGGSGNNVKKMASADVFLEKAHEQFLSNLHGRFMKDLGVNIMDLRIESFKIIDQALASQISKQAIITAKTQTELANLSGKNAIAISTHNRDAKIQQIKNDMFLLKDDAQTKARTSRKVGVARADAECQRIIARGRADAMKFRAEARADAMKIEAEAQAVADRDYVAKMGASQLGKDMALLKIKTRMVTKTLEKTNKVLLLDSRDPLKFFLNLSNGVETISGAALPRDGKKTVLYRKK